MAHNLAAEMSRIMSKAVRQGFTLTYVPPAFPGDLPRWTVASTREGYLGIEATAGTPTRAYEGWAALCGLPMEPA